MKRHNIPTADFETFTDAALAHAYLDQKGAPIVVKADGLAAGKGVVVATTLAEAHEAVDFMLLDNTLGVVHNAGEDGAAVPRVVIEEFLQGEEASFIVMVDGKNVLPLATSQDHKRLQDGDQGPNTGGMGAYSPAPVVTPEISQRIMDEVIYPTVRGMANEGNVYTGFLYAGVMITADGTPKVLEFNCRFGDPETQPIMMRLQSDLVALCDLALEGKLDQADAQWDPRAALGVVMAAGGYPDDYRKGDIIIGLPEVEQDVAKVFHAGTALHDGRVVTNGGRVLCAVALGDTVAQAQARAYDLAKQINWNNLYYRDDIGYRAVERERQQG
jgi:phosphoribosylamine--glycine ligase